MKGLRCFLVLPIAFAFSTLTLASGPATASVVNYSVSGSFANGATFLAGSILTIDTTAGTVSNSNLLVSAGNIGTSSPANTFTDANINQNGGSHTPFDCLLADRTAPTLYRPPLPQFQNSPPSS